MKPVCQIVFEYIDSLEVGDFVTRKNLIKYVADNSSGSMRCKCDYAYCNVLGISGWHWK